jgi:hypothetical protein
VASCLEQFAPARGRLAEALEIALASKTYITITNILPFVAYFLAENGRVEQGLELWALVQTQPFVAHSKWFADLVGAEFAALAASVPTQAKEAAGEQGRTLGGIDIGG